MISQPFLTSLNNFNLTMQKLFPKQTAALYNSIIVGSQCMAAE